MKTALLFIILFIFSSGFSQKYQFTPMLVAIQEDNIDQLKYLVESGADIEEIISDLRDTPVDFAVKLNHQSCALYLLQKGAKSRRYIEEAVLTGDVNWVKQLLAYKFDDNELVMSAVESKKVEMVQFLIDQGYDADFIQKQRLGIFKKRFATPLDVAIANQSVEITLLLAKNGADLKKTFDFFYQLHEYEKCKVLIDHLNAKKVDLCPYYLLSFNYYNPILPQLFIDKGVNVKCVNENGYNALQIGLLSGRKETVRYCANVLKLDINEYTINRETPLMLAIKSNDIVFFNWALDTFKLSIDETNNKGESLLFYALQTNDIIFIDAVLAKNPNINIQDEIGETVMMKLLKAGNLEVYKKIWGMNSSKIDFKLKNNKNHDLLGFFIHFTSPTWSSIKSYINLGCDPNLNVYTGENLCFYLANKNDFQGLLEAQKMGVSMIPYNANDEAPTNASFECVQFLLQHGANINQKSSNKYTSYFAKAISENKLEHAKYYLENGFVLFKESNGGSDYLFHSIEINAIEMTKLLLKYNVNLKNKNNNNQTPLDFAIQKDLSEQVTLLKSAGAQTQVEIEAYNEYLSEMNAFSAAVQEKKYSDIKRILTRFPSTTLDNKQVSIIYLLAIENTDYELLELLFSKKIDPNIVLDNFSRSALHFAASFNNDKLVRFLIQNGVDPKKKDATNAYPYRYAKDKVLKAYLKSLVIQ